MVPWIVRACRSTATAAILLGVALLAGCAGRPDPADLVLLGGKIVTLDPDRPQVRALAARDGKILALGSDETIRRYVGEETRVIELQGELAVPGFIEGHGHFTGLGRSLTKLDLTGATSWEQIVEMVAEAALSTAPDEWILGWGWHQEKWDTPPGESFRDYPTHASLSAATPDHPVLLKHAAGSHAGMVNARAMRLAGIDDATPDPQGGTILRDDSGRATGLLRENAYRLALDAYTEHVARRSAEQIEVDARHEIELADRECLSKGLTSFQDAGSDAESIRRLKAAAESGELDVRLWVMLEGDADSLAAAPPRIHRVGGNRLTVGGVKYLIDGALGSHGAWLLEPYSDQPQTTGLNTGSIDGLERAARYAIDHGLQLAVHAIGDRGNRETLDLYERLFADRPEAGTWRWRVEHAQHLNPDDVPRFAGLDVIASMQAVHCTSDGPWVPERLGHERAEQGAYLWRALLDSGAVVINGTDTPVEDVDPLANFHAAVTRMMSTGAAFYPAQAMSRMEALRAATIDAAYAAFEDDVKGSLVEGKLADVTVLSEDILSVPDERLLDARVLFTIVGGEVKYERQGDRT